MEEIKMDSTDIIAVFTADPDDLMGGGVPFVVCKNQKELEKDVMDLCRVIGATSHAIGPHVFIVKR